MLTTAFLADAAAGFYGFPVIITAIAVIPLMSVFGVFVSAGFLRWQYPTVDIWRARILALIKHILCYVAFAFVVASGSIYLFLASPIIYGALSIYILTNAFDDPSFSANTQKGICWVLWDLFTVSIPTILVWWFAVYILNVVR